MAAAAGASVNKVEDMANVAEADIYLAGHDHRKWAVKRTRLRLSHGNEILTLKERKIVLGRTGSFQEGYTPGKDGYIHNICATPSELGGIEIILTPTLHKKDGLEHTSLEIDVLV